ncbi:hypothetical protein C8F01DRAFT_1373287 [Mycena amicta]|nr:hypothetical protein C8F01DRAFT_1373287 [Mycena amicta]
MVILVSVVSDAKLETPGCQGFPPQAPQAADRVTDFCVVLALVLEYNLQYDICSTGMFHAEPPEPQRNPEVFGPLPSVHSLFPSFPAAGAHWMHPNQLPYRSVSDRWAPISTPESVEQEQLSSEQEVVRLTNRSTHATRRGGLMPWGAQQEEYIPFQPFPTTSSGYEQSSSSSSSTLPTQHDFSAPIPLLPPHANLTNTSFGDWSPEYVTSPYTQLELGEFEFDLEVIPRKMSASVPPSLKFGASASGSESGAEFGGVDLRLASQQRPGLAYPIFVNPAPGPYAPSMPLAGTNAYEQHLDWTTLFGSVPPTGTLPSTNPRSSPISERLMLTPYDRGRRRQPAACLSCRKLKIACSRPITMVQVVDESSGSVHMRGREIPLAEGVDGRCEQCIHRNRTPSQCVYPAESRRGLHSRIKSEKLRRERAHARKAASASP